MGSVVFVRGPVMDTRRSFDLAARQDDFDILAPDEAGGDLTDIPSVTPANDNTRTKDGLSTPLRSAPSPADRAA